MPANSRYPRLGALVGLCFPLGSLVSLWASGALPWTGSAWGFVVDAHRMAPLLPLVDTAPVLLGWAGYLIGARQARIAQLTADVARQSEERARALETIQHQHALVNAILEGTTDAMWVRDREGIYRHVNGAAARMLHRPADEIVGRSIDSLVPPDLAAQVRERDLRVLATGQVGTEETENVPSGAGTRSYLVTRAPLRDGDGRLIGVLGVARDITDRKAQERELVHSHSVLAATLEATADALLAIDNRGRVAAFNRKLLSLWDIPAALATLGDAAPILAHIDARIAPRGTPGAGAPDADDRETTVVLTDGRIIERQVQPQYIAGHVVGRVLSFRDITERERLQEQLHAQAFSDALTGLANRALFRGRLEQALARAARTGGEHVAVVYLDLDDFKAINDTLGHAEGDRLLRTVAERLLRATRGFDTVARLGGDEFAVLLEGMRGTEDAEVVVERIAKALARAVPLETRDVYVTASVGLAHYRGGESADELLRNADTAMYQAKHGGKACSAVFEDEMHRSLVARRELAEDLRGAAERGELRLVYQPIVDLATTGVTGVEALVRWQHPHRGLVQPGAFVPLAEETGQIIPVGRWVLRAACAQLRRWDDAGLPAIRLSVNVSGRQLEHPSLLADVREALADSRIAADRLLLEVTESAVMTAPDRCVATLRALKALGVSLALDDFGTGYSSLGYLQQFPVDVLKIDKTFIDHVARGGPDAALARVIVALGETLGLHTVAEGVERTDQHSALQRLGCGHGQGFLFARPLEADAVESLLGTASVPS